MLNDFNLILTILASVADEADKQGLYKEADELTAALLDFQKIAVIKTEKIKGKTYYVVKSEKNKKWTGGRFTNKKDALERLKEVEMFKHMKKKKKK